MSLPEGKVHSSPEAEGHSGVQGRAEAKFAGQGHFLWGPGDTAVK